MRPALIRRLRIWGAVAALLSGLALVAVLVRGSTAPAPSGTATAPSCPWLDSSLSVDTRVQMLLGRMTLDDKINMVTGGGFSQPYLFFTAGIPSLCIPAVGEEDGPLGVGGVTGVTQLPAAVALAASFDTSLAHQYGQVIGAEEHGKGAMVDLGPTVNIDRDPRWGRSFETFSEDPFLAAAMAVSEIRGVQSEGEMSQVKHFAVYNQETNRDLPADDAIISQRALHEIYLPAFWAATTQAGAASVMCAYSSINGQSACQNQALLTDTLDQRWGFPGFVTSDYAAIHSTVASADAGTDQEMPAPRFYGSALKRAVDLGEVSTATLNQMVGRILRELFRFNEFNHPPTGTTSTVVTNPTDQATATKVAEDGTVLLKNSDQTLPLRANDGGSIAVIGPAASAAPTDTGGGSAFVRAPFTVTPLQGIQADAGTGTTVTYTQGLPTDTSLAPIPTSALTPAYQPTGPDGSYTGTLTAPETGTYVLAFRNPRSFATTNLSLDGQVILANPSTPPTTTYSVAVNLQQGQGYTLTISGSGRSANLSWATPSELARWIAPAVTAARSASTAVVVVSDDTESEAADRAGINLPSAQDELISAVAAANPRTVVVVDAGAPVAMPWLDQVASVVDPWYPGESNGTALASVLFGSTDPSGHLPVTFPTSLSQVPASTPQQFPGVGGQVDYSEGIDVGYRHYDATNETPLFPFGFGLSYTTFEYSHLTITPTAVVNRTSNPGTTSCSCNGQANPEVTVSATVTNTGKVAGADVAQLYLGDPAAAAEPPRQLEGFDRVELAPGASQTVTFTLTGHDLSYFNETANGWVLPDGRFDVFVGDSSALNGLPLRSDFVVARTVGARYVTLTAPTTIAAGSTGSVTATLVNDGDIPLDQAQFKLNVPSGWTASNPAPVKIGAGSTVTEPFQVTAPANAKPGTSALTVDVTGTGSAGDSAEVEGTTTTVVPFASMTKAFNNVGISDSSDEASANYDAAGDSFSAHALAAGEPTPLTPGGRATIGGVTFTWPSQVGGPNNVIVNGQIIDLSGSGDELGFLGSASSSAATGSGTITYTDGSTQPYSISMADWSNNAPVSGDQIASTTTSWNFTGGTRTSHPVSVYFASVPLDPSKTVATVTLPTVGNSDGTPVSAMHIFSIAVGNGSPTTGG